jgi:hypothetical protein
VDDGVQKLLEHLLGSLEGSGVLDDEGQKEDQPTANSDGRKDPDVEHWMFIGRWKLEVLSNERHVGVRECVVMGSRVQVMEGGHGGLCDKFMLRGNEG